MPCRVPPSWSLALILSIVALGPHAAAQQTQVSSRGPRFFLAAWSGGPELDASGAAVLRRRLSLALSDVTIGEALRQITAQADLDISYSPRAVPLDRPVSLHAEDITVAAALTEILLDTPVDVSVTVGGHLALVRRTRPTVAPVALDTGTVRGQVRDSATGSPIAGATVSIERRLGSAVTDAAGRYRIDGLAAGTYTVQARYIGYRPASASVTVTADGEATGDLVLAKTAQLLEQVVVTGTIVPTVVKALPTPVSVISENDIAAQRPHTVQELFRQAVPTAVSWDFATAPGQTAFSARGANTLSPGSGQMKVFVDGIEAAWPTFSAVDLNSVERIEVVRGPQAAAIYGPDAIGGVVQIFTKRGDPSIRQPELEGQAAVGVVQTPYTDHSSALRQEYRAIIRGGAQDLGYSFGASYSRTGDYVPEGEQSNPSVYGGIHFTLGMVSVDASGRYYTQNNPSVFNPELSQTGFAFYSRPLHWPSQYQNQSYGTRINLAPTTWWTNTLTLGVDRFNQDIRQVERRFTTPDDTLLFIFNETRSKTSIGYTTSLQKSLNSSVTGSLTAGVDHYSLPITQYTTSGALNTTGTVQLAPGYTMPVSRSTTNSTGYFAQGQLGWRDALFLTGGVRADKNSDFGDTLGAPISPRVGVSYVQGVYGATLKLRGSWGRAIRAPSPGQKFGAVTPINVVVANPGLGPERQRGWDAGLDVAFGTHGSLGVTYYDQVAEDLIQIVQLVSPSIPTSQYQNVGRVKNTGFELDAAVYAGPVRLKAQYGYTKSSIERLPPNYTGDLRIGEQSLATPKHTAGMSATLFPLKGTTIAAGLTYVGSWRYYDLLALYRCFGGTGPCRPTALRDYITEYPSFVKLNATISQQITQFASGFISINNLANNEAHEAANSIPVMGRTTTVGFRFRY